MLNWRLLPAAWILLAQTRAAGACWAEMSLTEIVASSPVVVAGRIESIDRARPAERATDIGRLRVERVLKNALDDPIAPGDSLALAMPAHANEVRMSTDIRFAEGDEGVWILDPGDDGFRASYPKDFQPSACERVIEGIIATGERDEALAPEGDACW